MKIFIFGASTLGLKVIGLMKDLGIHIDGILDNDKGKWGRKLDGITIYKPNIVTEYKGKCHIVISSMYYNEIYNQLITMNVEKEKIISYYDIFLKFTDVRKCLLSMHKNRIVEKENELTLINLPNGFIMGGVEKWSINMAEYLQRINKKTLLIPIGSVKEEFDFKIPIKYEEYSMFGNSNNQEKLMKCLSYYINLFPIKIINNGGHEFNLICNILKKVFPEEVTLINVIHNDCVDAYSLEHDDVVDGYLCVSEEISRKMKFHSNCNDIRYIFIPPLNLINSEIANRKYTNVVRIGFASRLVVKQKRCDYLIKLVEKLEEEKISYILNIAGEGDFTGDILQFIDKNKLGDKIYYHGKIPYEKMNSFWENNDIYLNLSDYEGTSLAMVEAMATGCIPIVTRVSGVSQFVNEDNGFVVNIGDLDAISKNIKFLTNNTNCMRRLSENAYRSVKVNISFDLIREYFESRFYK